MRERPPVRAGLEARRRHRKRTSAGETVGRPLSDVTRELGITWKHTNGATAGRYPIETMGGGAAFLDYNRDGHPGAAKQV